MDNRGFSHRRHLTQTPWSVRCRAIFWYLTYVNPQKLLLLGLSLLATATLQSRLQELLNNPAELARIRTILEPYILRQACKRCLTLFRMESTILREGAN